MKRQNMKVQNAIKNKYSFLVLVDLFMMVLLLANLVLIIFDWIYSVDFINRALEAYLPAFQSFYEHYIHVNFQVIDLTFVSIFLAEFFFSWALAIIKHLHHKWFFYPFIHWYDLVGCIPVGSMRFIRVLRVYSIVVRLQNMGVIDLKKTSLYAYYRKYYDIVMEEISDRVIINILVGIQDELKDGGKVMDRIITNVIKPRQQIITEWISNRIQHALIVGVRAKEVEIHEYVQNVVAISLQKSSELKAVSQIPIMGKVIAESIEKSISSIINNAIDTIITDLGSPKNQILMNEVSTVLIDLVQFKEENKKLNALINEVAFEVIEEIKTQVTVKKWMLKDQANKNGDNE